MAYGFERVREGYRARLLSDELALLRQLFGDLAGMLYDTRTATAQVPDWVREMGLEGLAGTVEETRPEPPADPALARLLPSARPDDEEADAEFRRLTQSGLRSRKHAALVECVNLLGRWYAEPTGDQLLTTDQAVRLAGALTDVRLVLAERLGIRTDEDAANLHESLEVVPARDDLPEHEQERIWMASVYEFLAWLQDSLVTLLLESAPREGFGDRRPPSSH